MGAELAWAIGVPLGMIAPPFLVMAGLFRLVAGKAPRWWTYPAAFLSSWLVMIFLSPAIERALDGNEPILWPMLVTLSIPIVSCMAWYALTPTAAVDSPDDNVASDNQE
jgi:hypothetical protein